MTQSGLGFTGISSALRLTGSKIPRAFHLLRLTENSWNFPLVLPSLELEFVGVEMHPSTFQACLIESKTCGGERACFKRLNLTFIFAFCFSHLLQTFYRIKIGNSPLLFNTKLASIYIGQMATTDLNSKLLIFNT